MWCCVFQYIEKTSTDWKQRQEMKVVGRYFCRIKFSLYLAEWYECWRGQSPKFMGSQNSIMKLHNSIYGAPLQIMQLYVNCGDQSPLKVHEWLCIEIELYGAPQFKSSLNYRLMCMVWVELFFNWLHSEVYADHAVLIWQDWPRGTGPASTK